MTTTIEVPFLIVGAGPTGMTLAALLADAGHRCLVVERRDGPQPNPSAHVVNARTLEIFRQAGFDMAAIDAIAKNPADAGHVNFVTRLNGRLIGRLPFERQGDDCLEHTPTPLRNISQHRLEPLMAAELSRRPEVELRYGTEWVGSKDDDHGVTSLVRDTRSGEVESVRSNWLLAADGAGSAVRKSVDIEMVGPASLQDFVAIHFLADLRHLIADRLGVLHFVMTPEAGGTFIAHDLDREWVFMCTFDPVTHTLADFTPTRCTEILQAAIGDPTAAVEVVRAGTWHMTAQVAERFRHGRVFLVGDAAHRFPPTGGMGLNTGVADAHNLAWKLHAVDAGWAGTDLLDSYEAERRPVAETNCHQSVTNAFKMVLLAQALQLQPGSTGADLDAVLDDPANHDAIAAAVQAQATHFDMLGLQLGYAYGAVGHDDPSVFTPTARVGERLPHGWLADGRSTLDLVDRHSFTLITRGAHDEWAAAAARSTMPIHHVPLDGTSVDPAWCRICELGPDGALLVRPDQHIAWRSTDGPGSDDPVTEWTWPITMTA